MDDQNTNQPNNEENNLQKDLEAQIDGATKEAEGVMGNDVVLGDTAPEEIEETEKSDEGVEDKEREGNGIVPDAGTAKEQLNQEDGIEIL